MRSADNLTIFRVLPCGLVASDLCAVVFDGLRRFEPNIDDGRRDNRSAIIRVAIFEMHAPAQESGFEHGAAPVRSGDANQDRLGAKFRMAGNPGVAIADQHQRVSAILRDDFERARVGEIPQVNAAFDFTANDVPVDLIAQILVGNEHAARLEHPSPFYNHFLDTSTCGVISSIGHSAGGIQYKFD